MADASLQVSIAPPAVSVVTHCERELMTNRRLQDRLREHAKAFDSLLSLIPAKMYYGEDTSVRLTSHNNRQPLLQTVRCGSLSSCSMDRRNIIAHALYRTNGKRRSRPRLRRKPRNEAN